MSNVLKPDTQQQVVALGRLGWSLRQIEEATGVRRETASRYLRAAGIEIRRPGGRARVWPPPKPANPATTAPGVPTDSEVVRATPEHTSRNSSSVSACEPYRELIVTALAQGRTVLPSGKIW